MKDQTAATLICMNEEILELKQAVDTLLALVEEVEWVQTDWDLEGNPIFWCPWCREFRENGHTLDCRRQAGIAKARGES